MANLEDLLDVFFGGNPSGASDDPLEHGFQPAMAWAIGQAFASAGPLGQYWGLLYASPRDSDPNTIWGQSGETSSGASQPNVDVSDDRVSQADAVVSGDCTSAQSENAPAPSQAAESRTLDVLAGSSPPQQPTEVNVIGFRPDRPDPLWYLSPLQQYASGPELQFRWDDPQPPPAIPRRRAHKPPPATPMVPTPPQPERDPGDSGPYFDVEATPAATPSFGGLSDAPPPEQFLPWGAWDRPENVPSPRLERGATGTIETVPTVPVERSFWSRGGTGLATGVATAATGVAMALWWNPVGWLAGATAALAIAGGVAATTASAVELGASYGGVTSAGQDVQMNRAVSAALSVGGSVGGILGGVVGAVAADDAELGFEKGAAWGGLVEGAVDLSTSLPGALRAVPGLWRAAQPWAKSLLLTPTWFFTAAGSGGGGVRSMARVFAAQGQNGALVRRLPILNPHFQPVITPSEAFHGAQTMIVGKFARNPALIGSYLKPGEIGGLSDAQAYARMGDWGDLQLQAPTLFGKAVERALGGTGRTTGLLQSTGQLRGPTGRFIGGPDFRGLGPYQGLYFESTTNAGLPAHLARGYPATTQYATFNIPVAYYFFLTP